MHECPNRIEPIVNRRLLGQRRQDPLAQQSRAHRRLRPVEHVQQRAARIAAAQRLHEFEIATRHVVQRHRAAGTLHHRAREVRHAAGLQLAQVAQQRAGGTHGHDIASADAQTLERLHAEVLRQGIARHPGVELPRVALREKHVEAVQCLLRVMVAGHHEHLAR